MDKLTEIQITAAHEVGHTLIAQHYGVPVLGIVIEPGGTSGYTDIDEYTGPHYVALEIALAGFVAEELAQGRDPDYKNFEVGEQYLDDRLDVEEIAQELEEPDLDIIEAIARVKAYLSKPVLVKQSTRLAKRLARHKRITFRVK